MPIFCKTMGTGIKGRGIPGTNPKIHIMAVMTAVYTNSFCTHIVILLI